MKAIRPDSEITAIAESCEIAALVLQDLVDATVEGISTYDLDQIGKAKIAEYGAKSACYNYRHGSNIFPAYTCISVNEEIVHGIGRIDRIVQDGDVVSLDVCVSYNGYIGDNARTIAIGSVEPNLKNLLEDTQNALLKGIDCARAGNRVGDISNAVESFIKPKGYGIVRDFVGHGVGKTMHELPQIPNFGKKGTGSLLSPGMTLAIEPMINLGSPNIRFLEDGWTAVTADKKPSAHFEHTILVTDGDPKILTKVKN
ncbi:MAG: type I methionyl aminopeptidase [Opitutae bacterium]|jgi:methionyl aminopeptidase|nr:type I methionyl aminopeptidase [Opitutae bacterium]